MAKPEKRAYASARKRADAQGSGFEQTYLKLPEGVQLFKPKTGTMSIDILPYVAGKGNPWADQGVIHYERTYFRHDRIGANGDSYVCPLKTAKQRCPICEHRARLMKNNDGDEESEEEIKALAPRQRQLFNVIDLKAPDKGIQIWEFSYHSFGKVLDARIRSADEEDDWDIFFREEGGFYLRVGFGEESFGGFNFNKAESIDFKPRKEDLDADITDETHCLDDLLQIVDYDKLKAIFLETADEKKSKKDDEDAEEEEEAPAPKKKRPAVEEEEEEDAPPPRKKRPVEEEEDEAPAPKRKAPPVEEEEEDTPPPKRKAPPVEEEEEDEAPAPPKKKRPPVEEEEEEPAPPPKRRPAPVEEEEEEEPAPVKKKKPAVEEEEEEEPEPPKKKKAPVTEDDDWDEFDAPPKKKK